MSSNNNRARSVRFAEGTDGNNGDNERPRKRPRAMEQEDDDDEDPFPRPRKPKSKKDNGPNQDEIDDVDDWEDDEEHVEGVASEKERLEAKRARREEREQGPKGRAEVNSRESTSINDTTSLATEGIEIEPFHMRNERTDGTGYFDGDTYVFRKRNEDEEPDAWLESLNEDNNTNGTSKAKSSFFSESSSDSERSSDAKPEAATKSKEELYAVILPLVNDKETIMQAVVRYGQLLKRQPLKRKKHKATKEKETSQQPTEDNSQSESFQFAQKSLNSLTEAANALLGMGDVDVYQKTKSDLLKLVPQTQEAANNNNNNKAPAAAGDKSSSKVSWEYKGSQDGQIHGPFTSEQMKAWIQAGYFVGAQAVQIRSVREKEKSNVQDMLSDLMDDDDDDNDEQQGNGKIEYVRGEWQSSDKVDYDAA